MSAPKSTPAPNPLLFPTSDLWASRLAGDSDFGDERLNARFGGILHTLAEKPLDSFPQAAANASEAKAIYRFVSNKRVHLESLLQPIADTTVESCRGHKYVLAIQDSSSANYSSLAHTTGLGKLNDSQALGLHFHTTMAVNADGIVLGALHQSFWSRKPNDVKNGNHKNRPIEQKESYKWIEGMESASAAFDGLPEEVRPRLIHIFDREGDIHEILQHITDLGDGAVIRAAQNRSVAGPIDKAFAAIAACTALGRRVVDIPAEKRKATIEFRSLKSTITPNQKRHPQRRPVTWTLVEAREVDAPEGVTPLRWLLWTTEPANTVNEVLHVIALYKMRWLIEEFHLILKSGCQIEALRLEKADRLEKAILMYSAVAMRLLALRDMARKHPLAPCDILLTKEEWHVLHLKFAGPITADTKPPTIKQAVLWIGRLGGHLNRKSDGMPGVRTLWRGWRDLNLLLDGYRVYLLYNYN